MTVASSHAILSLSRNIVTCSGRLPNFARVNACHSNVFNIHHTCINVYKVQTWRIYRHFSTSVSYLSNSPKVAQKYTRDKSKEQEANSTEGKRLGLHGQPFLSELKSETLAFYRKLNVRELAKKYGLPFFIWYSTLYFGGMGACYLALEMGLLGGLDVIEWASKTPIANYFDLTKVNPMYGNIAAAIGLNELMEVMRLPLAVLTVPYIKAAWDRRKKSSSKKQEK